MHLESKVFYERPDDECENGSERCGVRDARMTACFPGQLTQCFECVRSGSPGLVKSQVLEAVPYAHHFVLSLKQTQQAPEPVSGVSFHVYVHPYPTTCSL